MRIEPVFLFDLDGTLWTASTSLWNAGVFWRRRAGWAIGWASTRAVVQFGGFAPARLERTQRPNQSL
jgi:hypothetical protein